MEFQIRINEKHAFILLIFAALVSAIGITMAAPPNPGHSWSDIECTGCISTANIADNSVTSQKVSFNYAGSSSKGGPASSVAWGSITGKPSGLDDGDQDTKISCSWSGWGGVECLRCGYGCDDSIKVVELYCQNGVVTSARTTNCCVTCGYI